MKSNNPCNNPSNNPSNNAIIHNNQCNNRVAAQIIVGYCDYCTIAPCNNYNNPNLICWCHDLTLGSWYSTFHGEWADFVAGPLAGINHVSGSARALDTSHAHSHELTQQLGGAPGAAQVKRSRRRGAQWIIWIFSDLISVFELGLFGLYVIFQIIHVIAYNGILFK